jgi:hypothetical protein
LKLSLRLPPRVEAKAAAAHLKALLEANPPYQANVSLDIIGANSGFDAPALDPWLARALDATSTKYYGNACAFSGEGGSIPFMGQLAAQFPRAQFCITGVLGSNVSYSFFKNV